MTFADVSAELERAIALGYERRDRNDMAPTIAYFENLLAENPGNPVLIYEVAGAYDTAGEELTAKSLYEEALAAGLSGGRLRMCLCQYGSTLRWLGELDRSLEVLEDARLRFPDSDAVRIFLALTLNELGRSDQAVGVLLGTITAHADSTDLGRYATGLSSLADWYAQGRPES